MPAAGSDAGTDAGFDAGIDGGPALDAGADASVAMDGGTDGGELDAASGSDAGPSRVDAGLTRLDAGSSEMDASATTDAGDEASVAGGCGCRVSSAPSAALVWSAIALLAVWMRPRRRASARSVLAARRRR